MRNDQFQRLVIVLRIAFLFAVAVIAGVIVAVPIKHAQPGIGGPRDVFYYALLAVSLAELAIMMFVDRQAYRAATGEQTLISANMPKIRTMPVILFSQAMSTAVYGLLYHLIGGSMSRSLSFLIFTFIGYVIFSLATVRYSALLSKDGQSLDS